MLRDGRPNVNRSCRDVGAGPTRPAGSRACLGSATARTPRKAVIGRETDMTGQFLPDLLWWRGESFKSRHDSAIACRNGRPPTVRSTIATCCCDVRGITHNPRPEDWPVMPVHGAGFKLEPRGFFARNAFRFADAKHQAPFSSVMPLSQLRYHFLGNQECGSRLEAMGGTSATGAITRILHSPSSAELRRLRCSGPTGLEATCSPWRSCAVWSVVRFLR